MDITDDAHNQEIIRLLRDDDAEFVCLRICEEEFDEEAIGDYDYFPRSDRELGWLGHFAKKSTHLRQLDFYYHDVFANCSEQSVNRFFEDLSKCNHIKEIKLIHADFEEIIYKLVPAMRNNSIAHLSLEECHMESPETKYLFDAFTGDMNRLEGLSIDNMNSMGCFVVDDGVMAGCIPSLSACTCIRKLNMSNLGLCTNSCSALSAVIPQMAALLELDLSQNSIDDDCIEFIARALAKCGYLQKLDLGFNRISDDGLDVLVHRLPRSVRDLSLNSNRIGDDGLDALVQGLPTNVHDLILSNNQIDDDGLDTLVRGLPAHVRALSLSYNQVTFAVIQYLLEAHKL